MTETSSPVPARVMIVEDEILIATDLSDTVMECGHEAIGIAADKKAALALAESRPDVAFVDLNLRDGKTGPEIGRILGEDYGITVVFITANPQDVSQGVGGTLGVFSKPLNTSNVTDLIRYTLSVRRGTEAPAPPSGLLVFD